MTTLEILLLTIIAFIAGVAFAASKSKTLLKEAMDVRDYRIAQNAAKHAVFALCIGKPCSSSHLGENNTLMGSDTKEAID